MNHKSNEDQTLNGQILVKNEVRKRNDHGEKLHGKNFHESEESVGRLEDIRRNSLLI